MKRKTIDFDDENATAAGSLTKKERKLQRMNRNKQWKTFDRYVFSGRESNARHSLYYQIQLPNDLGTSSSDEKWIKFQHYNTLPLPVTFRLGNGCNSIVAQALVKLFDDKSIEFIRGKYIEINGQVIKSELITKVKWIGDQHQGWQCQADSASLASNDGLQSLSSLLKREVSLGHLVRQELVSMLPVILLNIQGHHKCLDMCAAPGSKTEQLLTQLHKSSKHPSGYVVANDADPKRIQTLLNRISRSTSPNLVVTNCTALELYKKYKKRVNNKELLFDRIVCDVPCSGDGTFRKQNHLWRLFKPRQGVDIHPLQLAIAINSMKLLRVGGLMCYSTCSINPYEDEAVVTGILRYFKGTVKLVECNLDIGRPGISNWRCDVDILTVGELDEESRRVAETKLPPQPFPHNCTHPPSEREHFPLHYCRRLIHSDNNTGGFFVALLEKVEEFNDAEAKTSADAAVDTTESMQSLGYNPKRKDENRSASSDESVAFTYSVLANPRPIYQLFNVPHDAPVPFTIYDAHQDRLSTDGSHTTVSLVHSSVSPLLQKLSAGKNAVIRAGAHVSLSKSIRGELCLTDATFNDDMALQAMLSVMNKQFIVDISCDDAKHIVAAGVSNDRLFTLREGEISKDGYLDVAESILLCIAATDSRDDFCIYLRLHRGKRGGEQRVADDGQKRRLSKADKKRLKQNKAIEVKAPLDSCRRDRGSDVGSGDCIIIVQGRRSEFNGQCDGYQLKVLSPVDKLLSLQYALDKL
jgi:16S rRNA C967 or C1407 C5-methylase (RsmB/RsmF family)